MTEGPPKPAPGKRSANGTSQPAKRQRYTPVACNECKTRKVKCSGDSTCRHCAKHGLTCVYDRALPSDDSDSSWSLSDKNSIKSKLSRMQASIDALLENMKNSGQAQPEHGQTSMIAQAAQHLIASTLDADASRRSSLVDQKVALDQLNASMENDYTMQSMSSIHSGSPPLSYNDNLQPAFRNVLWPLSKAEASALMDDFREELETLHPFINLEEMRTLLDQVYDYSLPPQKPGKDIRTVGWDDKEDSRNVHLLRLIIACALATRSKQDKELSRDLMNVVEESNFRRMRGMDADMKDLAIATMLSVYHSHTDEINLAWRKIGVAARMCLELGMHKATTPPVDEIAIKQAPWVAKMFWCIYVLDRRYSFMTTLPFTFRDEDIDPQLPLPDKSAPYLLPMVTYGRLGAKVMPAMSRIGGNQDVLDNDTCMYLGNEIDRWMQSTCSNNNNNNTFGACGSSSSWESRINDKLSIFCRIRCNQMRLSLYKHAVNSHARISKNPQFATLAVQSATDNIRIIRSLKATCSNYEAQALHYNFFLITSVVVLYLAIRNAPNWFSGASHEYFAALKLLKTSSLAANASPKLCKTVQTLETAAGSLGRGSLEFLGGSSALQQTSFSVAGLPQPAQSTQVLVQSGQQRRDANRNSSGGSNGNGSGGTSPEVTVEQQRPEDRSSSTTSDFDIQDFDPFSVSVSSMSSTPPPHQQHQPHQSHQSHHSALLGFMGDKAGGGGAGGSGGLLGGGDANVFQDLWALGANSNDYWQPPPGCFFHPGTVEGTSGMIGGMTGMMGVGVGDFWSDGGCP